MLSQSNAPIKSKVYQHDFTNVSTQNSSQHSNHSFKKENFNEDNKPSQLLMMQEKNIYTQYSQFNKNDIIPSQQNKEYFYKKTISWLAKKYKKFKIKIQTLYLAISYLIKYIELSTQIKYRSELIGAVCLLLASKMNEIHVPSIKCILNCFDFTSNKKKIIEAEQEILQIFDYEIGLEKNSYSIINEFLSEEDKVKRKNAQKLLFLSLCNSNTLEFGEEYLGWSIIYLIRPQILKKNNSLNDEKLKKIAFKVYKIYKQKIQHQDNKVQDISNEVNFFVLL